MLVSDLLRVSCVLLCLLCFVVSFNVGADLRCRLRCALAMLVRCRGSCALVRLLCCRCALNGSLFMGEDDAFQGERVSVLLPSILPWRGHMHVGYGSALRSAL